MKINQKCINTARIVSAEMITNSQIGDVRSCLASAPAMFVLFKDYYNFFGGKNYVNRDRFILGDIGIAPLYYLMLNMFGISFTLEDLKKFGAEGCIATPTPNMEVPGIDASITSKSQAIPMAVGLAIASKSLSSKFNAQRFNVISNYTYCFVSVSNLEEGVSQEAMSLAGSLKLSRLVLLCNFLERQTDGENVKKKYKAMGWNVIFVRNSNNQVSINLALKHAKVSSKPTLILFENKIEKQFPNITKRILSQNEVEKLKADLQQGGNYKIDNDIRQYCARTMRRLKVEYNKREKKTVIYKNTHPQLSEELNVYFVKQKLSLNKAQRQKIEESSNMTTSNEEIVSLIKSQYKCLMTGSIKEKFLPDVDKEDLKVFSKNNYRGQNIVFGNRENSMAEICTGVSLFFEAPTYVYAPICLLGQMFSGVEHAAKCNLPVLFGFYQSGSCVNQQKTNIELYGQLEWLRNLNNLEIYQPANTVEMLACYTNIYELNSPSCIVIPQQSFQPIESNFELAKKGAYVLTSDGEINDYTFIASGREVYVALRVKEKLKEVNKTVKIISIPSWTRFVAQPTKYKDTLINLEKENIVVITTTNSINNFAIKLNNYRFVNINDFTSTPEAVADGIIEEIVKQLNNTD